jgi:hypothetical protein
MKIKISICYVHILLSCIENKQIKKKFLSEIRIEKAATAGYSFNPGALKHFTFS